MNRLRVVLWGLVAVTFLAAGAMAAWRVWQGQAGEAVPTAQQTAESLIKTDFDLLDHAGQRRSAADFRGQWMLVFFGYTFCPDVCPTTLAELATVARKLGDSAKRVQVLFVTVDPERDTPDILAGYVTAFNSDFIGLTGSREQIAAVAREFKIVYQKVEGSSPGIYSVDHSAGTFIFDTQGQLRLYVRHGQDSEAIVGDINRLLSEA